jgi:hypothetical protein
MIKLYGYAVVLIIPHGVLVFFVFIAWLLDPYNMEMKRFAVTSGLTLSIHAAVLFIILVFHTIYMAAYDWRYSRTRKIRRNLK